jgi:hypothetical protein
MPYFQYKGTFDNKIYAQTLQYVFHLKPREFEEQIRSSLILSKLYSQVTYGLNIDEKEIRQEYEKINKLESTSNFDEKKYQAEKAGLTEKLLNQKKLEKFKKFAEELNKRAQ